jgi:hypothetical protein
MANTMEAAMKEAIRYGTLVRVIDPQGSHQDGNGLVLHVLFDGQAFVQFDLYYRTYIHVDRLVTVEA